MNPELLTRLLSAVGIILFGLVLSRLINKIVLSNRNRKPLPFELNGKSAILYFTISDCVPCKTVQRPALREVQSALGEKGIQIVEIDATRNADLAKKWRVMSVPTTFIIDAKGISKFVNHGVVQLDKLLNQIEKLSV